MPYFEREKTYYSATLEDDLPYTEKQEKKKKKEKGIAQHHQ